MNLVCFRIHIRLYDTFGGAFEVMYHITTHLRLVVGTEHAEPNRRVCGVRSCYLSHHSCKHMQIAPLHQRSLKPSCPPSSIALCGSFDQRQEHPPCHASALTDGMESVDVEGPVQGSIWTAEASTTPFSMKKGNCPYPDDGTHGTEFGARPPPSVEEDVPPEDDPDVQFRVRLDDAALAPRVACDGRQRDGHDGHRAWDSSSRPVSVPGTRCMPPCPPCEALVPSARKFGR